jgi:hypothetical protein
LDIDPYTEWPNRLYRFKNLHGKCGALKQQGERESPNTRSYNRNTRLLAHDHSIGKPT